MSDVNEKYSEIRSELSKTTDAFGSMTLDGEYITASNLLIAFYLEQIVKALTADEQKG
tara:strand:+ start:324 stop:497 length:174 start_codon:yes stop_codon:yes gene_type:complete